jgi:hypothetical protein
MKDGATGVLVEDAVSFPLGSLGVLNFEVVERFFLGKLFWRK